MKNKLQMCPPESSNLMKNVFLLLVRWWDEFAISGVVSSWVQIDITSMYTSSCNGFVEVEVYTGQNTSELQYFIRTLVVLYHEL